jgi:hypothetical protein
VASLRRQLLDRQIAECTDGLPELVEVAGSALAEREVIDEPPLAVGIERVVEECGDQLDELAAVEVVHDVTSVADSTRCPTAA